MSSSFPICSTGGLLDPPAESGDFSLIRLLHASHRMDLDLREGRVKPAAAVTFNVLGSWANAAFGSAAGKCLLLQDNDPVQVEGS